MNRPGTVGSRAARPRAQRTRAALALLIVPALLGALAQPLAAEDLLQTTLPQRSALHEDPTLEAPLTQLVEAFRRDNHAAELVGIYRAHLASYPQDRSATVVLVRLLLALRDPGALAAARLAVQAFPDHAYLHWLLFQALSERHDAQAVDALAQAVALETVTWRRNQWAERLVDEALKSGRRDLAENLLVHAAAAEASAAGKLAVARRQAQAGLAEIALQTLTAAAAADPPPEVAVDVQAEAATVEAALGRREAAAQRLDALLARLGAEHWRRAELTRRRLELAGDEHERLALIESARLRHAAAPDDEGAVLDYARLLLVADRRREALAVLTTAGRSPRIEQEVLALHARLHDPQGLDAWLAAALAADPSRADLAMRRVRTLFELGRGDEARALRERTSAALPAGERAERLLALARDLRRDGRPGDAAQVFELLVAAEPARVELLRELAETWLAAGNRGRAEELLDRDLPAGAAPEQVLEAVQLMMRERQYRAAERAIAARLAADPGFFELRVQAIHLGARAGDVAGAAASADAARALTDTPARYRLWLEAAVEAAGSERDAAWLEAEGGRLREDGGGPAGAWTPVRGERLLAFAEVCATRDRVAPAVQALGAALADPRLPASARSALRRRLVALSERLPDAREHLPEQLRLLAVEDPALADECRARAALQDVPTDGQRGFDAAGAAHALADVQVDQVGDATLVERMRKVFQAAGDQQRLLACLRRLTALEPAIALHWEDWLEALATGGDEDGLRGVIRHLLAGVENLELAPEVRSDLGRRLADSCWRSASALAAAGDWPGMLGLLDQAEAVTMDDAARRWSAVARAMALHQLGRNDARDQVLAELAHMRVDRPAPATAVTTAAAAAPAAGGAPAADPAPTAGAAATSAPPDPDDVVFPDGLKTTVSAVRARFAQPPPHLQPVASGRPPLPPWAIAWSAGFSAALDGVWLAGDRVVVACANGEVVGIERASGRRRWVLTGRTLAQVTSDEQQSEGQVLCAVRPALLDGVVVLCRADRLDAFRVGDGALLWSSTLIAAQHVVACAGLVVAWDDRSGTAMGFAVSDGRLRWRREVPDFDQQHAGSALTVDGGTVLVMGRHAALLDGASGDVHWGFTTAHLTPQRPALTRTAAAPAPVNVGYSTWGGRRGYYGGAGYISYSQAAPQTVSDLWQHVAIARLRTPQATAVLAGGQLVVGDGGGSLAVPLAMPLRSTSLPTGSVLGACGSRLIIVDGTTASIVDLAKSGEVVAAIDCAALAAPVAPAAPAAPAAAAGPPWLSGTCVGRLAWLSGPGGMLAIDIERGAIAVQTAWPAGVEVPPGDAPVVQRSPAGVRFGGTSQLRIGESGAVDDGMVVLPAGTRRLVALVAGPAQDAPGTGHGR